MFQRADALFMALDLTPFVVECKFRYSQLLLADLCDPMAGAKTFYNMCDNVAEALPQETEFWGESLKQLYAKVKPRLTRLERVLHSPYAALCLRKWALSRPMDKLVQRAFVKAGASTLGARITAESLPQLIANDE
jgi:hypothetical protein